MSRKTDRKSRVELCYDYLSELDLHERGTGDLRMMAFDMVSKSEADGRVWIDIGEEERLGFLIVNADKPKVDLAIEDGYVRPEYRRQGLMIRTLDAFVDGYSHWPVLISCEAPRNGLAAKKTLDAFIKRHKGRYLANIPFSEYSDFVTYRFILTE